MRQLQNIIEQSLPIKAAGRRLAVPTILCLLLSFITSVSVSQNAPVTTCATVAGAVPGNISVPVTVTGFSNIGAVSLTIDYDYSVMQFVQGTPNPALPGFLSGDADLSTGYHRITMGWFGSGVYLPDGSAIMTLVFNYMGGNSPLTWFENGSSCEYADGQGNVLNDVPTETYYLNGFVCGFVGSPGEISGNDTVCQGQTGENYSVVPLANVTGYNWTVPEGATIVSGGNTNIITVNFSDQAIAGPISVNGINECGGGPVSSLSVTVNELPVANAGDDQVINYGTTTTLQAASGGSGTYSYYWWPEEFLVDPNVQNPQTVQMTYTVFFNVLVTNQESMCQSNDQVVVTVVGGPLHINPVAIPQTICLGESVQLYANAGGGSENYTYLWTCIPQDDPPWGSTIANPLVSPDTSKQYLLQVFDGFNQVTGFVNVNVFPLPSSYISGDTNMCGQGNIATLKVDLTGNPPWSFNYTNGITTVIITNVMTTPFYFMTMEPGTYTVINLEDANCFGESYGSATVNVFPVPEKPEITIIDYNLVSSSCCGNQWYKDNALIPGATGQVYTATESGEYYVIVSLNGCVSEASDAVDLIVGIEEISTGTITLSPNPAVGQVRITFPQPANGTINISLSSPDGRLIDSFKLKPTPGRYEFLIDVAHLDAGLYFVTLCGKNIFRTGKLIIR